MMGKINGNVVGIPNPITDWNQTDETKADFIKNKPDLNVFANALKGTTSGEAIGITDISPIEHNMAVSVRSENLFKTTNYTKGTLDNKTGGMSSNTATKAYALTTDYIYLKSGAYIITNKTGANLRYICFYDANKGFKSATWTNRVKTFNFTVTEDCYVRIDVERNAEVSIDNFDTFLTEYEFMMNEGTTPTSYAPYIADISTVKLYKQGKNLFNNDTSLIKEVNYITTDGVEGKRNGYEISLPIGTYTIRAIPNKTYTDAYIYGCVVDKGNKIKQRVNIVLGDYEQTITFNIENGDVVKLYDGINNQSITASQNRFKKFDIQLEVGTTPTEYEPYIEPTVYDVQADGIVEGVKSLYPSTSLYTDTSGAVIDCTYNRDINKAFAELQNAIISLGGNV